MKTLSMIRLATYTVLIAIVVVAQKKVSVVAVGLSDPELHEAAFTADAKLKQHVADIEMIVNSDGFFGAKRSGSELLSIATKAAADSGLKILEFHRPEVKVQIVAGRLAWRLTFERDYGPGVAVFPAERISITVDDASGAASVKDTSAVM